MLPCTYPTQIFALCSMPICPRFVHPYRIHVSHPVILPLRPPRTPFRAARPCPYLIFAVISAFLLMMQSFRFENIRASSSGFPVSTS